ncbi:uncharacterized protein LOC105218947 isoform X1 [Zeugodacus cucurbitae]|nr:uncharacterized protein LOC105218947 isoform X1 [Zeugodacus cucurbitae]
MALELETDYTWGLTKCGEITTLLTMGREEFFLNCKFCDYTFLQLDKFIRHMCKNHMQRFNHLGSERSSTLEDVDFEEPLENSMEEIDDKNCVLKGFERVEIELDSAGMDTTLHMKEEDIHSEFISDNKEADKSTGMIVDYNSDSENVIVDKNTNDKQFIIELINLYRKLPSLWNIKHKHYKNQKVRQYHYDILLEKYKEKYPDADKTDVIKKISNLRSGYRRALKNSPKVVPTAHYYDAMDFLRNHYQPYLDETEKTFQVDEAIVKTETDTELANSFKPSPSNHYETHCKNAVKEEPPELSSEQKFIIELIELYRTLPALWDRKCIEYNDRESKAIQYNILLEKYKERYPDAVKSDIKKRMSNLRSSVRREQKRPTTTNLYYFNALSFICNIGPQNQTQNSLYDFDDTQDTSIDGDGVEPVEEFSELESDSEYTGISKHRQIDTMYVMDSEHNKKLTAERKFIIEFINLYHSLPALWDINIPSYQNRAMKNKQYEILLEKYREIMPNADKSDVKKKIATLRSNYQREVKRLQTSKLKEPALYYYDAISFLCKNDREYDSQDRVPDLNEMEDVSMEADNIESTKIINENESDTDCTILTAEKKFIIEFISLYRTLPALWDLNNESYYDRKIKNKYYEVMRTKYREIMPNANILDVKKKIATLRSNYQRELKRLRTSKLDEPTLYYFDAMNFLRNNNSECDDQDPIEDVNETEAALVDDSSDEINDSEDDSVSFVHQTDILLYTDEDTQDPIEKKFILELIELYRTLPALWKKKDKQYHDRELKRKQYEILLTKYREMYPNAEEKDVRSKINSLRTNYYTELKRVGTNGSSNRYYFDALSFLRTNRTLEKVQKVTMERKRNTIKFTPPKSKLNAAQCVILADMYKGFPSLWDETDIAFRFNNRRQETLDALHEEFNNRCGQNLTQNELRKEIARLRKICSHEKKQRLLCKQENIIYKPTCVYYEHLAFLEVNVVPFICPICEKIELSLDKHKIHLASHDGSAPFKCPICERGFQASTNFTVHLRRHVQDYTYSCEICNKQLPTTTDLKAHMRCHTGEKPFICEICGKSYRNSSQFSTHMHCHDDKPQFKCDHCDKAFYKKIVREEHIKCVHQKVRDKICPICNKAFKSTKHLRQHKEIHAAEKKYVCRICGKRFAQYAGLSGHVKSHGTTLTELTTKNTDMP